MNVGVRKISLMVGVVWQSLRLDGRKVWRIKKAGVSQVKRNRATVCALPSSRFPLTRDGHGYPKLNAQSFARMRNRQSVHMASVVVIFEGWCGKSHWWWGWGAIPTVTARKCFRIVKAGLSEYCTASEKIVSAVPPPLFRGEARVLAICYILRNRQSVH